MYCPLESMVRITDYYDMTNMNLCKPGFLFTGHTQNAMGRHIWGYSVGSNEKFNKNFKLLLMSLNMKVDIQMIMMGKSICHKWIKPGPIS